MVRSALVLIAAISLVACGGKSTATTAPQFVDTFSVAGSWTGCITESNGACAPVSMTLADSSVSDTSAVVTGSGNWLHNVAIHGKLFDARVTLNASATDVLQGWTFTGTLAGNSLSGNMTIPGNDSTFAAVFTRSP